MNPSDDFLVVGRFLGAHGVKGWLQVYSDTDPADNIGLYDPWWMQEMGEWKPFSPVEFKRQGKKLVVKLDRCDDRDAAGAFSGREIAIRASQRAPLAADQYYWSDLIGLRVINQDGIDFGTVSHLLETGANDVLVVKPTEVSVDEQDRLIPFVLGHAIKQVDLTTGRVLVEWDVDF